MVTGSRFALCCCFTIASLVTTVPAFSSTADNLDELFIRKSRLATASWGYFLLENSGTGIWQPETLMFTDVLTSAEVWKLTNTPVGINYTQDISTSHWSANGKWVMFGSKRNTGRFNTYGAKIWMLSQTNGSKLQVAKGASSRSPEWMSYINWNPASSDVFFAPGSNYTLESADTTWIYKNSVDDDGTITRSPLLGTTGATSRRLWIKKSVSPDGRKIYFHDSANGNVKSFVATITGTPSFESSSDGYNHTLNFDLYWGSTVSWSGYHDQFIVGAANGMDGIWAYIMPETSAADGPWWRARLTGSGVDGAPVHISDRTAPYEWGGELEPVNTRTTSEKNPDPWGLVEYPSHFTPDRWGHYGVFSKGYTGAMGTSLIDLRTHNYWNEAQAFSGASTKGAQHHDWEAWSDWSISSGGVGTDYVTYSVRKQNYKDPRSQRDITYAFNRYNSTSPVIYESLTRPTQSPDGTKAMFNSTFLNATDNDVQLFWAVAYYPYPPEIKRAINNGSYIHLVWDFNQGASCASSSQSSTRSGPAPNFANPRTYATRGWPHEVYDCPPSPREIDVFRLWISEDNSNWKPVGTTAYNNCRGSNECGMWAESAWTYDVTQPPGTTRYYGVTSVEYSGLESRKLSNVWKVSVHADGTIKEQGQQAQYPENPGGKSPFYRISPPAIPSQYGYKLAPATADGQYLVKWKAPSDSSIAPLIRYYNVYSKDGALPFTAATPIADRQKSRIASIPASTPVNATGEYVYLDWAGAPDGSTRYVVTAVDYQGNESLEGPGSTKLHLIVEQTGADNPPQAGN